MNWIRKLLGFSDPRRQPASQAGAPSGPEDALRKQKAAMDPYGPESLEDMWVAARHLCSLLAGRKDIVDIAPGNRFGEGGQRGQRGQRARATRLSHWESVSA